MACAVQLAGRDRLGCVLTVFGVVGLELDQVAAGFVLFCVVGGVGRVCVSQVVVCLEKLNVVGLVCAPVEAAL